MKPQIVPASNCNPTLLVALKHKLDGFYRTVPDYSAFATPSDQVHCWTHIADHIRSRETAERKLRVLEIGAGRSGFGAFLVAQNLRNACVWVAQDVTAQNRDWLAQHADEVLVGDVETLSAHEPFDLVFSTFVLEHVVNPEAHLNTLAQLVKPRSGTIFVFCPRYDVPGYATPSSRHLQTATRLAFMAKGFLSRLKTILTGKPAFLVQTDLAAFHQPFFTDSDAVHWASAWDLRAWARGQTASTRALRIGEPRFPSKDWVVKRLLTIGMAISFDPPIAHRS